MPWLLQEFCSCSSVGLCIDLVVIYLSMALMWDPDSLGIRLNS